MHEIAPLIQDLAVILGVASIIAILFQKIHQPVVLGYLIAGIIISPYTLPYTFVSDIPNIQILSSLGIIFLMFSLGLEFSFHKLKRLGASSIIIPSVEVIGMMLIGWWLGVLLGWSFFDSLFLGAALAISSTTIIIKSLEELKLKHKHFAEIVVGALVVEDLLAILLLVALSTIVFTSTVFSVELLQVGFKLLLVIGSWFLLGYFVVPSLFRHIMPFVSQETLTLMSVALCLFLVCVAAYFHYSTALGAFIMGSILAETPLIHRIEKLIFPIRNIFAAVFFVSVGMLIDPHVLANQWPVVLLVCIVTFIGKLLVTSIPAFFTGHDLQNSVQIGLTMTQIGEFSFIIATLGLSLNVISPDLYPILVAVACITTFTTPHAIYFSENIAKQLEKHLSLRLRYFANQYTHWVETLRRDPEEQSTYKRSLIKLIINGIIIVIIFNITANVLFPTYVHFIKIEMLERGTTGAAAILLSSPFIWGMLVAFRPPGTKTLNHMTPGMKLSWILTLGEVIILGLVYIGTWWISLSLLVIVLILFGLLYKHLDKSYQWFENQLLVNLQLKNTPISAHDMFVANNGIDVIELQVEENSPLIGEIINPLNIRRSFGVNILGIIRNNDIILLQKNTSPCLPADKLLCLGNEHTITTFAQHYSLHRL